MNQKIWKNNFVIVPVPMNRKKEVERGFNQSELIACLEAVGNSLQSRET